MTCLPDSTSAVTWLEQGTVLFSQLPSPSQQKGKWFAKTLGNFLKVEAIGEKPVPPVCSWVILKLPLLPAGHCGAHHWTHKKCCPEPCGSCRGQAVITGSARHPVPPVSGAWNHAGCLLFTRGHHHSENSGQASCMHPERSWSHNVEMVLVL